MNVVALSLRKALFVGLKMKQRIKSFWPLTLGSLIIALGLILTGGGHSAVPSTPAREMDVLVSFLQKRYGFALTAGAPLVIDDTFFAGNVGQSSDEYARSLLADASARVPADLIRDFCGKNAHPGPVWPALGSRLCVKFLTQTEAHGFFSDTSHQKPDGWDRFYAKYPKSPGIITISRVGFSRDGNLAMFYLGNQIHWLAGCGGIHIFRKQGTKWVEDRISFGPQWVS